MPVILSAVGDTDINSDSKPAAQHGVGVAYAAGSGWWEKHTIDEDLSHVTPRSMGLSGRIFGTYTLWLADGSNDPEAL